MNASELLFASADRPSAAIADQSRQLLASPLVWAVVLGAVGIWLMLPRGRAGGQRLGALLGLGSLGLIGWQIPRLGLWGDDGLFLFLAAITVIAAVATITARNPVYSAIWFAITPDGT